MVRIINYDRRDSKYYLAGAVIFTLLELVCTVLFILDEGYYIIRLPGDMDMYLFLGIVYMLPILCAVTWIRCLDCFLYFRRLKRYGYEVPEKKKLYSKALGNLPRTADFTCANSGISVESVLLAFGSWFCSLGILISAINFFLKYVTEGWWCVVPFGFILVIAGAWCVQGVGYWYQRLRSRFRDDVENDDGRRVRRHFVSGMVVMMILLAASAVFVEIMYAGAGVVVRAREMSGL